MIQNTLEPYKVVEYNGIEYTNCRDFNHISRYRGLRQIVHEPKNIDERCITLESPNAFSTNAEVKYYEVTADTENRLDLIAYETLGDANYSWVIAYFNGISDGFTVKEGQKLYYPTSISSLFNKGELLASVNPSALNLGEE